MPYLGEIKLDAQEKDYVTNPFKEISTIRICIECFIVLDGGGKLCSYLFAKSIINGYGANLE